MVVVDLFSLLHTNQECDQCPVIGPKQKSHLTDRNTNTLNRGTT